MLNLGQNNTFSVKYKNILTDKEYQQMKDTVNQEQSSINQRQQQKQETEVELQNLYKEMIGAYSDNDYNLLQQLLEILFNFTRNGEELLNEYHVPLVMKSGFLDIFSKILEIAEAIYFTFANMMGNLDRDVNLQIKGYIMQMDIIKTVQETFQNIQSFIDELNQLVYSQKRQCNFFNAEEDCSGYKHEQIREFFQTFSWFISQLIRDPISKAWRPLLDNLKPCLIVLFDNYTKISCNDSKIIQNVMWALHNGTGSSNFYINSFCQLMGNKRLKVLISFVHEAKLQLQYQAIKLLSNLLSGEDTVVQNLIDIGILKALEYGLDIQYEIFRGEVIWSINQKRNIDMFRKFIVLL
ncbi:Armadillo-type fold [Pseudocohnilembus persalinus]|uniref:Armadillo-type fold n=1 Tax=Pseudocohnilembus persalinus TaxID=266149 RepID=A0A0V0QU11_PSEPJ|nr:Armadillo-type fold [Pseudocohnilembus persalinus]|eukprot:KRX05504.1 Armadillo-type fold [Pseudocohnilembus persalinus]